MQLRNIVVGVSSTPTSRMAGEAAFKLAALTGAQVHVITAVDEAGTEVVQVGSDRFRVDAVEGVQAELEGWVHSIAPGVPWRVVAMVGKPAESLISVAEEVDADLIVVGNVRMQGLGRVLGSVGNDVAHHAPCNVLVVKTV